MDGGLTAIGGFLFQTVGALSLKASPFQEYRDAPPKNDDLEALFGFAKEGELRYEAEDTLEFRLSPTRDAQAVKLFFAKTLAAAHPTTPGVITVDKNAAYPKAIRGLKGSVRTENTEVHQSSMECWYCSSLIMRLLAAGLARLQADREKPVVVRRARSRHLWV